MKLLNRLLAFLLFISFSGGSISQVPAGASETKPYKVLTNGRQLTIKSNTVINHVMLWTTGGDRVVEQRGINDNTFSITIPVSHKAFFLMVGLANGKVYTEKIGMQ